MKLENRKGLVRGVLEISQDRGQFEDIRAYTFWFRHDEPDLEKQLDNAMRRLLAAYSGDRGRFGSAMLTVEWKDYRR